MFGGAIGIALTSSRILIFDFERCDWGTAVIALIMTVNMVTHNQNAVADGPDLEYT